MSTVGDTVTSSAVLQASSSRQTAPYTSPSAPAGELHATPTRRSDVLSRLPPPPPFDLRVSNLSIGVPPPSAYLPLPIPIPIPRIFRKKQDDALDGGRPKAILTEVSAECRAGEMLAIIGGSGSGKTTLLHSIVGRLSNLPIVGGEVGFVPAGSAASHALRHRGVKERIGFVRQNDYLLPHLTVRETLSYAAALRLPTSVDSATRALIVEQTISELGLEDAADTVVGGYFRKGISGGERRRLSIGCVLVTLPSILCLDEPTTGLDASTSYSLLLTLSRLATRKNAYRTVILSIHQPRSDAFNLFDRLVLLGGGKVVYSGPRSRCLNYFSSLGTSSETLSEKRGGDTTDDLEDLEENPMYSVHLGPKDGTNPLDWLVDLATLDTRTEEKEATSRARVEILTQSWKDHGRQFVNGGGSLEEKSIAKKEHSTDRLALPAEEVPLPLSPAISRAVSDIRSIHGTSEHDPTHSGKGARPGWAKQTVILTKRARDNVTRDFGQIIGLSFQAIGLGIILGFTFYQIPETPSGIQSLKTLAYQQAPCYFYLTLIYNVYRLCETDLIVFDREREDNLYAATPYVISDLVANAPLHVLTPTLFSVIIYFMAGLRTDDLAGNLFVWIANNILCQLVVVGFTLFVASFIRVYATASLATNAAQIFLLLTSGYLIVSPPIWLRWIRWLSPYFYSFRILITSQFRGRTFSCPDVEGVLRSQCDGNALMQGLKIPVSWSLGYYFSALIGLFIVEHALSCLVLHFFVTGGVQHAAQISDDRKDKDALVPGEIDVPWARVIVEAQHLGLAWERSRLGPLLSGIRKDILTDVNVKFPAGEVTAILGPSGAGKSSLLQLLAFRPMNPGPLSTFHTTGPSSILFNGLPAHRSYRGLVAFVEQDDEHHYAALTVRETLRYASILRLPASVSLKRKLARAEEVMSMLGLRECANTLVGGPLLKGISGGEKRRLSLAVQMINGKSVFPFWDLPVVFTQVLSDPSILIVDEPTSGLDALTASNVMAALKKIASESGRTVIVTLHQPRSDIYQDLDNIVVLAKGGKVAYSGPRNELGPTFGEAGYPIPPLFNPADHILDTISRPDDAAALVQFWRSREAKTLEKTRDLEKSADLPPIDAGVLESTRKSTPAHIALAVVIQRMMKNLWRQQPIFWLRLQQAPLLGVMFLLFFERLGHGAESAQNRIGLIQEFVLPIPFVGLLNNIAIYPLDRAVFFHEYQSSARYSATTFIIAFTLVELPLQILSSLLWVVFMNVATGMQTSARIFFEDALITLALQSWGESLGIAFASFYSSMGLNVSLVSTAITTLTQSCGVVSVTVPDWLGVIAWGTVMKASSRVVAINEFTGLHINCTSDQVASGACLAQTGEQLLEILGFRDLRTGKFIGIALAIAVINRLLAWAILRLKLMNL